FYTMSPTVAKTAVRSAGRLSCRLCPRRRRVRIQRDRMAVFGHPVELDLHGPFEAGACDLKLPAAAHVRHRRLDRFVGFLAGELLAGIEEELEPVLEDRAHVILLVEDHVVGEADAEQIALADVKVDPQHEIALLLEIDVEVALPDQAPVVGPAERGIGAAQILLVERAIAVLGILALVEQLEVVSARLDREAEDELGHPDLVAAALDLGLDEPQTGPDVAVDETGGDLVGLARADQGIAAAVALVHEGARLPIDLGIALLHHAVAAIVVGPV